MRDPEVVGSNTGRSNTHGRSRGYCLGYSEFASGEIVACGKCKQIFLAKNDRRSFSMENFQSFPNFMQNRCFFFFGPLFCILAT